MFVAVCLLSFVNVLIHRWTRIGFCLYGIGFSALISLQLLSAAMVDPETLGRGEDYFIFLFVSLLFSPFYINLHLDEVSEQRLQIRLLNWLRNSVIIVSGISGMMWYLYPERPHLEPTTVLLGFAAAYITYHIDRTRRLTSQDVHMI